LLLNLGEPDMGEAAGPAPHGGTGLKVEVPTRAFPWHSADHPLPDDGVVRRSLADVERQ
jgi:hypothetical protein